MIMPEVRVETTVDIEEYVDVDIEDVLDDCSELEIKAVISWLKEGDYLVKEKIVEPHDLSFSEEQFWCFQCRGGQWNRRSMSWRDSAEYGPWYKRPWH